MAQKILDFAGMVFPAKAGMILHGQSGRCERMGVPRESGDDPLGVGLYFSSFLCSPRKRG
ncbi:hypothetical protein [uncultured Dubosiella sp.]|uniref:hypothetical protein n=1 Tax=uncultured Dubosiella sp. TaxID=1937011 RepID=UPI0025B5C4EC|nr:hypothetical protein [uncultured Dubosiella sp.]